MSLVGRIGLQTQLRGTTSIPASASRSLNMESVANTETWCPCSLAAFASFSIINEAPPYFESPTICNIFDNRIPRNC